MSEVETQTRAVTVEKRYELLRQSLAHYLLLQVSTFIHGAGQEAIKPAMEILTQKSADLKTQAIQNNADDPVDALSQNLAISMGDTFNSDYTVEKKGPARSVTLRECGCIKSIMESSEDYGLSKPVAKSIFCGACMNGYRKSAEALMVGFKGKLSDAGCNMSFSPE